MLIGIYSFRSLVSSGWLCIVCIICGRKEKQNKLSSAMHESLWRHCDYVFRSIMVSTSIIKRKFQILNSNPLKSDIFFHFHKKRQEKWWKKIKFKTNAYKSFLYLVCLSQQFRFFFLIFINRIETPSSSYVMENKMHREDNKFLSSSHRIPFFPISQIRIIIKKNKCMIVILSSSPSQN